MTRGVLVAFVVFGAAAHMSAQTNVLTRFGMTAREAHDSIFMTLTSGMASMTGERSVFKTATDAARAEMVRAVVAVAHATQLPADARQQLQASVAEKDKKLRFVNPAYERRSAEWKMCFRAGQPAVDAARAAANDWLETLPANQ